MVFDSVDTDADFRLLRHVELVLAEISEFAVHAAERNRPVVTAVQAA